MRIASNTYGSGSIEDVAFTNPDGSTALLVLNDNGSAQTFGVNFAGQSFGYTLPAGAVKVRCVSPGYQRVSAQVRSQ